MNRYTKIFLTSLLALIFVVPAASARPRVFVGFGGGFYGPAFYGPAWYGPGWYGYGYGPYGTYYGQAATNGDVKFENTAKDAMVYVDGGYAGTVGNLKTFHLKAGQHDIELRDPSGHAYYQEHLNVIAGKTLKLNGSTR